MTEEPKHMEKYDLVKHQAPTSISSSLFPLRRLHNLQWYLRVSSGNKCRLKKIQHGIMGDTAAQNGLRIRIWVTIMSVDDAARIWRGRSCVEVMSDRLTAGKGVTPSHHVRWHIRVVCWFVHTNCCSSPHRVVSLAQSALSSLSDSSPPAHLVSL